jgi:TIR domain
MNQQASVFISYRRSDAGGHAGRLFDRLKLWFDADVLFYDMDSIQSGDIFPQRLELAVSGANVVLVLIGPDWLAEINRRATLAAVDFVRIEIELALRLQIANGSPKVIPVLLGGAKPPSLADLHENLRAGLQRLPSLDVHEFQGKNTDWDQQFVRLRELIARLPGVPAPRYRPPVGEPKPFRVIDHLLSPHFRDPRGALARVREALLAGGNAAIVVPTALYGMGGVGKTQLALKYSYEYGDSYVGVWWLRAEADNTLQLDARDACIEAGAPLADGEVPSAAFKHWLGGQEQSWLLVFDNAESADALRPHLPQGGPHHVLITSRDLAWGGVARPIELEVWSDDEGAEFLASRLPAARLGDLQRLSRALGGLQLALEQAAAFLEQTGGAVADYCTQIEGVDTAALVLDEGRAGTGYERSVLATLSLAFPHLSAAAQQLLRICAFFSAEPIPERYFREGVDHLPKPLASAAHQGLAWERVVGELRRSGIVERVDVASLDRAPGQLDERMEKALVLHRLTLEVARHALSVPAEDGPRAQNLLRAHCPPEVKDPIQWPRFGALLPHLFNVRRPSAPLSVQSATRLQDPSVGLANVRMRECSDERWSAVD